MIELGHILTGWASVKYRGRKMDHYKNLWLKMKSKRESTTTAMATTMTATTVTTMPMTMSTTTTLTPGQQQQPNSSLNTTLDDLNNDHDDNDDLDDDGWSVSCANIFLKIVYCWDVVELAKHHRHRHGHGHCLCRTVISMLSGVKGKS